MPFFQLRRLVISLAACSGIILGSQLHAAEEQERLPLDEVRTFVEVLERIKQSYVEPIDDKTLLDNAIKGMLSNLDPHSSYLSQAELEELQESISGEFGGLGIEIGSDGDNLKIISPIDDTPAHKAGLQAGDLITRIDGQTTKDLSISDAVRLLRGKPGSKIKLGIMREGKGNFDIQLTRANISTRSVRSRTLEDGYVLLRISQFQANTAADVSKELHKFTKQPNPQGLVLDLRNNPGGLLQAAVDISDLFLSKGLIVYTKGNTEDSRMEFFADPHLELSAAVPMVVLINGGSASAAEILAGALQDHSRAVLLGTKSFGKGSVQNIVPLNNDSALKLTTSLYYTPSGRSIQAKGIQPDIVVEQTSITQEHRDNLKEADLGRHLHNNNDAPTQPEAKPDTNLIEQDFQLSQALNLLKGINISRKYQ